MKEEREFQQRSPEAKSRRSAKEQQGERMVNPFEELMEQRGLSQSELAIVLQISAANVSNLVRGRLSSVSRKLAQRVEEAFGIPAEEIQARYRRWREEQEELVLRRLRAKIESVRTRPAD